MLQLDRGPRQFGIASWRGHGDPVAHDVYAIVPPRVEWIRRTMDEAAAIASTKPRMKPKVQRYPPLREPES